MHHLSWTRPTSSQAQSTLPTGFTGEKPLQKRTFCFIVPQEKRHLYSLLQGGGHLPSIPQQGKEQSVFYTLFFIKSSTPSLSVPLPCVKKVGNNLIMINGISVY